MNLKRTLRDNRGFLLFLFSFALLRTAVADWNPIPSGSMRPTLLEGDVVLVNRLAFDLKVPLTNVVLAHLGEPRRGDIVTFRSPRDNTLLIKRVVALPGDGRPMPAAGYFYRFALPSLVFHVSIAYAILRSRGVPRPPAEAHSRKPTGRR